MGGDIARFGAVEGAVAGGAAAARDSGADPVRSMMIAMRECLQRPWLSADPIIPKRKL